MKRILTFLFVLTSLFASSQTQYIGAPLVTVVNRGNFKVDSILYLPKRQKTPTDTGALRYQISDSSLYVWTGNAWRKAKSDGTVTSVGLTMPSAFNVANSPVTSSGTLAVTAAGTATQYIRGDGTLAAFPESSAGGAGVSYYLNGSVSQGTIGGSTYYEMNKEPVIGTGTNFTSSSDGLIAQFITDAGDPNRLQIPAGAWNFEMHFSASSPGGTPTFYVELLKYSGTTFTSIASSSTNPRSISEGTTTTLYLTSLAVPQTTLLAADRLAVRVYVAVSGRTITFHTEDNNLAEIITTFSGGISALNGLTSNTQYFAVDTLGTDFNISSVSETHTFNIPTASATKRGLLSSTNWSTFNNKVNISDTATMLTNYIRHAGFGLLKSGQALLVDSASIATRARVQKGIDSLGAVKQNVLTNPVTGTGTTNRSVKFTGTSAVGNGSIADSSTSVAMTILSGGNVGINNVAPVTRLDVGGAITLNDGLSSGFIDFKRGSNVLSRRYRLLTDANNIGDFGIRLFDSANTTATTPFIIRPTGFVGVNNLAPSYQLDIGGNIRSTTDAAFATTSGNVLVGTTVSRAKLSVSGIETASPSLGTASGAAIFTNNTAMNYGLNLGVSGTGDAWMQAHRFDATATAYNLLLQPSGGNVAIGNTSPSYKLDVSGTLRNTTGAAFATSSGNVLVGTTTDGGLYKLDVQGALRNTTGANFATSSGNVVIGGTGTGGAKLDVVGSGRFSTNLNVGLGTTSSALTIDGLSTSGQGASITFRAASSDIAYIGRSSYVTSSAINTNGLSFGTLSSSINFLTVAGGVFVERFRIDSATGNVGVSTASPTERLHVTGRIRATTIDSTGTGTAMNMLYSDATGVIKKAAVPSGGGGSGTVTSVATGFGLSGGTITTTGTLIVDSASVATRARVQKGIDSVTTLANTKLSGTGISGYFPKWTGASSQDTSQLFQLGRNIGIGTATPTYRLHLPDAGATLDQSMISGMLFGSDGNGVVMSPGATNLTIKGGNTNGSIFSTTIGGAGHWGINTTSLSDATFNVNGNVKIVTIDSTSTARNMLYQDANGVIKKSAVPTGSGTITTSEAVISANYTVTSTDYFVFLPALETAGRNIVLPSDPGNGRQLIFFNTSNDATYKWTFTNVNVQDATGTVVTTLANSKSYTLVYYSGLFRITSVY